MADDKRLIDNTAFRVAAGLGLYALGREVWGRLHEMDLRGKVVLITGGSRGLGLAIARDLVKEGARVVLCARDPEELERARQDLVSRGGEVLPIQCNITDRSEVENMVAEATRRWGGIDILVNNAGVIATGPIETVTPQDFEDMLSVMFWGVVYATWAVLPQMRERRNGRIVNITSIGGKVSVPHLVPYSAAKFAAVALSEGLRAELAKDNITVTTVVPGLMRTGSHLNAYMKGQQEAEFVLFGAVDTLPMFSISAESAAKSIVRALKRGEAEVVLSLPAKALVLLQGVFPGTTADIAGLINRALPRAEGSAMEPRRGLDVRQDVENPRLSDPLGLGEKAAMDLNQFPGPVHRNEQASDGDGQTRDVLSSTTR